MLEVDSIVNSLGHSDDLVVREIKFGSRNGVFIFLSTIVDKKLLEDLIQQIQMNQAPWGPEAVTDPAGLFIRSKIAVSQIQPLDPAQGVSRFVSQIVTGKTIVFIEGFGQAFSLETLKVPKRDPGQPLVEASSRGSQIGFVEQAEDNVALLRNRLRSESFCVKKYVIGVRSQANVYVCYIRDIIHPLAVDTLHKRLSAVNIDLISQSSSIGERVVDNHYTPFPLLRPTQRIDNTARVLNQGKFVIIVDGDPNVLLGPATIQDFYQTEDDYSHSFYEATFIRWLRMIAFILALFLPSLYVAYTEYNPELLPLTLGLRVAASRVGVPFPAVIEVLAMELVIEILREASMRMPKQMGQTIGIVGGLVIGQATVAAGLVSDILIVIIAITAIATFVPPSYEISTAWRMIKYFIFTAACLFGLLGVLVAFLIVLFHLASLKSFGVEYISPLGGKSFKDFADLFVRLPVFSLRKRASHMSPQDITGEQPYSDPQPHPQLSKEERKP
jgi:hypothetical protein